MQSRNNDQSVGTVWLGQHIIYYCRYNGKPKLRTLVYKTDSIDVNANKLGLKFKTRTLPPAVNHLESMNVNSETS